MPVDHMSSLLGAIVTRPRGLCRTRLSPGEIAPLTGVPAFLDLAERRRCSRALQLPRMLTLQPQFCSILRRQKPMGISDEVRGFSPTVGSCVTCCPCRDDHGGAAARAGASGVVGQD
jgi:hypothetical protein